MKTDTVKIQQEIDREVDVNDDFNLRIRFSYDWEITGRRGEVFAPTLHEAWEIYLDQDLQ